MNSYTEASYFAIYHLLTKGYWYMNLTFPDSPSLTSDCHLFLFPANHFLKNKLGCRGLGIKWKMYSLLIYYIQKQDGSIAVDQMFNYVAVFSA